MKVALSTEEKIHVGGAEEFEIPLKTATMSQVFAAVQDKDRLMTVLPETAKIRQVNIQVHAGLLGAALNAAATLVSYPYGCTEQLVHSTIPNLVLLDLVSRAGIDREQLGPLKEPLVRAEKNAALGIRKLIQRQRSDGGFALWRQDPNASLSVTLMVLSALKSAEGLKIEGVDQALYKGLEWLRNVKPKGLDRGGSLYGYELARASEVSGGQVFSQEEIAFVKKLAGRNDVPVLDLIHALRIFVAHKDKRWSPFNDAARDSGMKEELVGKLQTALSKFDQDLALGDVSSLAILGFPLQVPSTVSAGMGVLADLDALPAPLESKLKGLLLSHLRNGLWISTFDTGQVIFNTRKILSNEAAAIAREQANNSRKIVVRKKDGVALGTLSRIPAGFIGSFAYSGESAALSELQLEGLEATEVARAALHAEILYSDAARQSKGVTIERNFYKITGQRSEKLDLSQTLHVGDVVVSELRVQQHPSPDKRYIPSRFLVIEDPIPSLAEGLEEDRTYLADAGIQARDETYWGSIKETLRTPEQTVRIAKVMPGGELRCYQVWRVGFNGRASIPPARAFDMYDESLQGNTVAHSIQVGE